jgi:hypothetical protein
LFVPRLNSCFCLHSLISSKEISKIGFIKPKLLFLVGFWMPVWFGSVGRWLKLFFLFIKIL